MQLRRYSAAVAFSLCCSYCYSDIVNNTTSNVVGPGLTWSMTNVLPSVTGLTVDGVIYRYTAVKNPADPMVVSIQNKNTSGTGFIFQKQDNWSGLPGNSITKTVPVNNIPIQYWGDGEIKVTGSGSIVDPFVAYKYRYDTCVADPQSNPACPDYVKATIERKAIESVDPLSDPNIQNAINSKVVPLEADELEVRPNEEKKVGKTPDERKKANNTLIRPEDALRASQLEALNNIPGLHLYSINMPGGVYKDVIGYTVKNLPDSRRGRSIGLAQESLHKAMVEQQYDR